MTMRASLIISAKDQASAAFGKVAGAARSMTAAFKPVQKEAAAADRAIDKAGKSAPGRFARIGAAARKMAGDLRIAERAGYGLGYAIGWTARKTAGLAVSTAKWGAIGLAGSAAYAGGNFLGGIIRTGAQFEQFAIMLKTVTGSAEAAKASMAWVQKFAAATPYELEEVMASFVKLKTRGLDPTDGTMRSLGDAASAMGKSIDDAVEMMADAVTGEFERLKEFGVVASNAGGKVTFNWMKNGKALTKTVKKDGNEIRKALTEIFDGNYGGAMEGQSRTFSGMISNLKDQWTGFQKKVADAGIFDRVKNGLSSLLDYANRLADDGKLDSWAQRISDKMSAAWEAGVRFVKDVDWDAVANGAAALVRTLVTVVGWIGKAARTWKEWQLSVDIKNQQRIADGWFTSDADKKQARANLFRLRMEQQELNWTATPKAEVRGSKHEAWLGTFGQKDATGRGGAAGLPQPRPSINWTPTNALMRMPKAPSVIRPGSKTIAPWTPTATRGAARGTGSGQIKALVQTQRIVNDVKVGGGVEVSVRAAPGLIASTTRLSSNNRNVPLTAKTGKAMAEAA